MLPEPRPRERVIPDPNTPSTSGTKKCYDFRFELQPAAVTLVRNAIAPLSEPEFNANRTGIISVGDGGFEITVHHSTNTFDNMEEYYTGYLCLCADRLDQFVCNKSMRKRVSLRDVSKYLDAAAVDDTVAVYVESDTDLLSFDFSPAAYNPFGPYTMATKFSGDVNPTESRFPVVTYCLEVVIPSPILTTMSTNSLEADDDDEEDYLEMVIRPTTVRTQVGTCILETETEDVEAWLTWPYWESMRKATLVADDCVLYLVLDPEHNLMLKFNVGELGYLVYLKYEGYCFSKKLDVLGRFFPLT